MAAIESKAIRVLVVDDSAIARDLIASGLGRHPGIEVVGKASDAFSARDKIVYLRPDVMTLDVQMPGMDGIEFLKRLLPQYPLPVVIVSAFTEEGSRRALEAIEAGAVDVVAKPTGKGAEGLLSMIDALAESVVGASRADVKKFRFQGGSAAVASRRREGAGTVRHASGKIIAIGASTGGTVALKDILPQFPVDTPPILVVQHMPAGFTRLFAESLDKVCMMRVKEAADGDGLERGLIYVAPGDFHMSLVKDRGAYRIALSSAEKMNGHRPSVDVLFSSVAQAAGKEGVGLILTGMGKDGARGMLEMRCAGARCLAQDEASSVVFGMPKEAYALGGAERFVTLEKAVGEVLAAVSEGG